jgi:hypothetical protein
MRARFRDVDVNAAVEMALQGLVQREPARLFRSGQRDGDLAMARGIVRAASGMVSSKSYLSVPWSLKMTNTATDQSPPFVCSIVRQDIGDLLQIRGRVNGRPEARGKFSLQVLKTGPSGSSTMTQSGTFSVPESREKLLGLATFNMRAGDHFAAELSLWIDGQTYTCKSTDKNSQTKLCFYSHVGAR